ncbi:MAG: response regulator, partial [Salinibacter sp.]
VLLVEDSPEEARLFAECLEEGQAGTTLRHEVDLDAGLAALRDRLPDVLVVDLGLPDSEGPATVRAVARRAPSVPIVVLTGDDDLQAALEMQKVGAADYLKKGELTPGLVARTLRWAIERSEMHAKLRQRDAWIRSITENIAGGVFRAGPTGRIQYANEALARMLGFDENEELIGRDLTTFYADPAQRGRMLAAGEVDGAEIAFERPDGST